MNPMPFVKRNTPMTTHAVYRRRIFHAVWACLFLVVSLSAAQAQQGSDWPHWLGPVGDGISPETGWNAQWTDDEPKVAWRADIGIGFSSTAAAGEHVYAMGYSGNGETVHCFNADTGEIVWQHRYPGKKVATLHEGGPGSTPAVHEGKVYTVGKEGQLFCLNAEDGSVVWSSDLRKLTGQNTPKWGFTGSPVIVGDQVIYQAGPTVALNKDTGKPIWRSNEYDPAYSTPAVFDQNGNTGLAVLNSYGVVLLNANNGKELARYPWETRFDTNATTPIVTDDKVFVSTGYNRGCTLLRMQRGQLQPIYENQNMSNHMNNSILYKGHLYGFDGNSHQNRRVELVCMELDTGKVKWRKRGLGCGSLLISDGKMIILSDEGTLVTAEATPAGYNEISRAKVLDGKCWSMPILSHGRVYARTAEGEFVCVDLRKD